MRNIYNINVRGCTWNNRCCVLNDFGYVHVEYNFTTEEDSCFVQMVQIYIDAKIGSGIKDRHTSIGAVFQRTIMVYTNTISI